MKDFLDELLYDFEDDNEHFMATFIKAIKTGNKEYVFQAHNLLQNAYEIVGKGLSFDELIDKREELNKLMKNKKDPLKSIALDKEDIISLVKGQSPNYSVMEHRLIKKHGNFDGSYGKWNWNSFSLEKCTEEELKEIYRLCKESWK